MNKSSNPLLKLNTRMSFFTKLRSSKHSYSYSLWVPVILSLLGIVFTMANAFLHGQEMSMVDEWMYLDYVENFWKHGFYLPGDLLSQQSLRRMACFGEVPFGPMGEACNTPIGQFVNSNFPMSGINSANLYTPITFFPQLTLGEIPALLIGNEDIFFRRISSLVWLVPTIWMFYLSGKHLKISNKSLLMSGVLLLGSPFAYWTYSYVNTDAPIVFFGALVVFLYLTWQHTPSLNLYFIPIFAIGILIKQTALIPITLILLLLIYDAINSRGIPGKSRILAISGVVSLSASLLTGLLWHKFQSVNVTASSPSNSSSSLPSLPEFNRLISNFSFRVLDFSVLIPDGNPTDSIPFPSMTVGIMPLLIAGGVIGASLIRSHSPDIKKLSLAVLFVSLLAGPILALLLVASGTSYFELPVRYASGILIGSLLMLSHIAQRKTLVRLLTLYGLILLCCQPIISLMISSR